MSALPGLEHAEDAWDDVVGQPAAVAMLRNAGAGDPPHAWLFVGPPGTGKREAARAFAGDVLAHDQEAAGDAEGAAARVTWLGGSSTPT
ncbi:MAG: ATP-binding protein [Acidimicrobiales bacterium]